MRCGCTAGSVFREVIRTVIVRAIGRQDRQAIGMMIGAHQVVGGRLARRNAGCWAHIDWFRGTDDRWGTAFHRPHRSRHAESGRPACQHPGSSFQ